MRYTSKASFILPEYTDIIDIENINENFETIDGLIGSANGLATLDSGGKVPSAQLPEMDYIPNDDRGVANGVATLDASGKVVSSQLPPLDYIPVTEKGVAGGVATLDAEGKLVQLTDPEDIGAAPAIQIGVLTLSVSEWIGDGPYTQEIKSIDECVISTASKIDIQPDIELLEYMRWRGIRAIYISNDEAGVITAHLIGDMPDGDIVTQVTVTEVGYDKGSILAKIYENDAGGSTVVIG